MAVSVSTMVDGSESASPDAYDDGDITETQFADGLLLVRSASGELVAAYAPGTWYSVHG